MASVVDLLPKGVWLCRSSARSVWLLQFFYGLSSRQCRKKYSVPYLALYAKSSNKDADLFNCFQRGHHNSLESKPVFLVLVLLGGLQSSVVAAGPGLVFTVGRYKEIPQDTSRYLKVLLS